MLVSELEFVVSEESEELEVVAGSDELLPTDGLAFELVSLLADDLVVFDQDCTAGAEPDIAPFSPLAGAAAAAPVSPEDGLDVL